MAIAASSCISFKDAIHQLKRDQTMLSEADRKSVIILGAGPAGLIRAIQSVMEGHRTTLVERRTSDAPGRCNTVALQAKTMDLLKKYGVYQSLLEEGKIYPANDFGNTSVRISDLEQAMKRVLVELSAQNAVTFHYKARAVNIGVDPTTQKALLALDTNELLERADIIVNAEGAHSSTNLLLDNPRIEVLPKVPVIAAIFEDDRPEITNVSNFFTYVGKSIAQTALSIYYYAIYFFRFTFMHERFTSQQRTIVGSLILKTPGQNYVGCGFTAEKSNQLLALQKTAQEKRAAWQKAQEDGNPTENLKNQWEKAEDAYWSFVKYWTYLSFCAANLNTLIARVFTVFFNARTSINFDNAPLLPLKDFSLTEIGADKATHSYQILGNSIVLIAGDALATVDPATGLGCNTALRSSEAFTNVLRKLHHNQLPLEEMLEEYAFYSQGDIHYIHGESRRVREIYRPDAVLLY